MFNDITSDQIVTMVNGSEIVTKVWKDFADDEKEVMGRFGDFFLLADAEDADILCVIVH